MSYARFLTRPEVVLTAAALLATSVLAATLYMQPDVIATWLAEHVLPLAALPRSMGSYYPGFLQEGGFAYQIARLGVLIFVTITFWVIAKIATSSKLLDRFQRFSAPPDVLTAFLIFVAGFLVYAYLAYPPYFFPTNARIHWVDIHYAWSDVWVYALPKLINPYFHAFPHALPGIYGGVSTSLIFLCLRRLGYDTFPAALGSVAYLLASNLLIFATIAEDINLSIAMLLLCTYSFLSKRWTLFGLATFLAFLARPSNLVLPLMFGFTYYFSFYDYSIRKTLRNPLAAFRHEPGLTRAAMFALIPGIIWNALLVATNNHFLFGAESTAYETLSTQRSIKVDGFTIERFSGTVLLHQLWVFPIPITLFAVAALFITRHASRTSQAFVIASIGTIAANILLVEHLKMWYFNIRYITYFYPLLVLAAFAAVQNLKTSSVTRAAAFLLVALSTTITFNYAFSAREKLLENPLALALSEHGELMKTHSSCNLYWTDHRSRNERSGISYLIKEDIRRIKVVQEDTSIIRENECLISANPHPELKAIYSGEHVSVYKSN